MRYQRKRSYRGGDDQSGVSVSPATPVSGASLSGATPTSGASPADSNSNTSLGSQPFNSFGFAHGASSAREAALLTQKNNNEMQHKLNKQSGGKRKSRSKSKRSRTMRKRSRSKSKSKSKQSKSKSKSKQSKSKSKRKSRRRSMHGGADAGIEVPTFPPIGGVKHAYSASDLSVGGNTTLIKGANDAKGDCYVNDTCNATAGGGSRRRRHRKRY